VDAAGAVSCDDKTLGRDYRKASHKIDFAPSQCAYFVTATGSQD
jgi:hypothetical protein